MRSARSSVVELERLVGECVEAMRRESLLRQIAVECWTSPVWIAGDHNELQQVFGSLLAAAVQNTLDGGRVDVAIESEPGQVIVAVTENASEQLDRTRARAVGSYGVEEPHGSEERDQEWLALRAIVQAHGGCLVQSGGDGGPRVIEVRLPRPAAPSISASGMLLTAELASAAPSPVRESD